MIPANFEKEITPNSFINSRKRIPFIIKESEIQKTPDEENLFSLRLFEFKLSLLIFINDIQKLRLMKLGLLIILIFTWPSFNINFCGRVKYKQYNKQLKDN